MNAPQISRDNGLNSWQLTFTELVLQKLLVAEIALIVTLGIYGYGIWQFDSGRQVQGWLWLALGPATVWLVAAVGGFAKALWNQFKRENSIRPRPGDLP